MTTNPHAPAIFRSDRYFRWRGVEVSRLEAFSDAIFALVLGLLFLLDLRLGSLADLWAAMKSLIPFAATFALLVAVWLDHYLFFRRFGLRDGYLVFLNFVLLFLVLYYSFPLKLVFTFIAVKAFGPIGELTEQSMQVSVPDFGGLQVMVFYGAGLAAVYGVYALMYLHAWGKRDALELNAVERVITRFGIYSCLIYVGFAVLSILAALVLRNPALAGLVYFGIGPAHGVRGWMQGARVERLSRGA